LCNRLTDQLITSISSGNFDVLDDEVEEGMVAAWLEKPQVAEGKNTELWRSEAGVDEETFSVEVDAGGRYKLCFESSVEEDADDAYLELMVGFNIRLQPVPRTLPDEERGPDMERALKLVESASFIENDWQNLLDHFDFLRRREAVHTTLAQQILGRVMSWTVIQALLVIIMAVGQVMYWKKFFEQRRYL